MKQGLQKKGMCTFNVGLSANRNWHGWRYLLLGLRRITRHSRRRNLASYFRTLLPPFRLAQGLLDRNIIPKEICICEHRPSRVAEGDTARSHHWLPYAPTVSLHNSVDPTQR